MFRDEAGLLQFSIEFELNFTKFCWISAKCEKHLLSWVEMLQKKLTWLENFGENLHDAHCRGSA